MRRDVVVGYNHVDRVLRLGYEVIQGLPRGRRLLTQLPMALTDPRQFIGPSPLTGPAAVGPRQRFEQPTTEAHICQPTAVIQSDMQRHVRARTHVAVRGADSGQVAIDRKAEAFEHGAEQHTVLEAVTSATSTDQLVLHCRQRHVDSAPDDHIEILERDRRPVRQVQCAQRLGTRLAAPLETDPLEIRVEVESRQLPLVRHAPIVCGGAPTRSR